MAIQDLYLLAINVTKRCNLACQHCYLDAADLLENTGDELNCDEVKQILDQVASRGTQTMVVLTGGEPLLRLDLEQMIQHGTQLGLSMVVGTNGLLLSQSRVKRLKSAGALGVGISLDSLQRDYHDQFRGINGSWEKTLKGIEHCREQDLSFQLHFTVTQHNRNELSSLFEFARIKGARVVNLFFLICTGRAESRSDLTPMEYERVISDILQSQQEYPEMIIRPRCAPHYKRIAYQQDPESQINRISGMEGDGCIAGTHYCRIAPNGDVTPCPYIEQACGNIREEDFLAIWDHHPSFHSLRHPQLKGACGECEYQLLCGGCRARPVAHGGDLMDADPFCSYVPEQGEVIPCYTSENNAIVWTADAQQRLSRIPGFIQAMVKKRTEAYVQELGEAHVTSAHMDTLMAKRFGQQKPTIPAFIASRIEAKNIPIQDNNNKDNHSSRENNNRESSNRESHSSDTTLEGNIIKGSHYE